MNMDADGSMQTTSVYPTTILRALAMCPDNPPCPDLDTGNALTYNGLAPVMRAPIRTPAIEDDTKDGIYSAPVFASEAMDQARHVRWAQGFRDVPAPVHGNIRK